MKEDQCQGNIRTIQMIIRQRSMTVHFPVPSGFLIIDSFMIANKLV